MKNLLTLLCLVILMPIMLIAAIIHAVAKLVKVGSEKLADLILNLIMKMIRSDNSALADALEYMEEIARDEFEVPAESQVPVADFLEYTNGNIYPDPIEAQDALEVLQKFFLGRDWYVIDPLTTGQVNACLVDAILSKFPNRYKRFAKLNGWRTNENSSNVKEPVFVERAVDNNTTMSDEAN